MKTPLEYAREYLDAQNVREVSKWGYNRANEENYLATIIQRAIHEALELNRKLCDPTPVVREGNVTEAIRKIEID